MRTLDEFRQAHGAGADCEPASGEAVEAYRDRLPEELTALWQSDGWCSYADGLIWVVDPGDFEDPLADWGYDPAEDVVFGRSGLGDLFVWRHDGVHYLHVHYGESRYLTKRLDLFMNSSLTTGSYLDDVLKQQTVAEARAALGPLTRTEMYAYVPALALGGEERPDSLSKVQLREQLAILAQLHA